MSDNSDSAVKRPNEVVFHGVGWAGRFLVVPVTLAIGALLTLTARPALGDTVIWWVFLAVVDAILLRGWMYPKLILGSDGITIVRPLSRTFVRWDECENVTANFTGLTIGRRGNTPVTAVHVLPRPRAPQGTEIEEDAVAAWISSLATSSSTDRAAALAKGQT